jgi:hypothetical protein
MNNRLVALSLAVLGATFFVSFAQGQRHGAGSAPAGRMGMAVSPSGGVRTGFVRGPRTRRYFAGSAFAPYFYSDYDSDYDYGFEPEIEAPPPPEVIVIPTPQPAPPPPATSSDGPVVLELHGDHWVRITDYGQSEIDERSGKPERVPNPQSAESRATPRRTQAAKTPSELPPAVLVFRDGHKEEVGRYVIMGGTIYISADYWSTGSWTRKVQIAELDVPATLKLNQERGANFNLPSGPYDVMIR